MHYGSKTSALLDPEYSPGAYARASFTTFDAEILNDLQISGPSTVF